MDIMDNAIPNSMLKSVVFDAAMVLLFTIMESILNYLLSIIYANITNNSFSYYQNLCLEHLFRLTGKYYSNISNGEVFTTIYQDTGKIQTLLSGTVFDFVSDCMIAIVMLFFLLFLQWDLLLAIIIIMPIIFLVQRYYQEKGRKRAELLRNDCGGVISLLQNMISNVIPFLYSGARTYCEKKYNNKLSLYLEGEKKLSLISSKNSGILNFLAALLDIIVLGYGGVKVIMKSLSLGGLVAFKTYTSRLVVPMLRISSVLIEFQSTVVSLKRINDFLAETEILEVQDSISEGMDYFPMSISFAAAVKNKNFSHKFTIMKANFPSVQ